MTNPVFQCRMGRRFAVSFDHIGSVIAAKYTYGITGSRIDSVTHRERERTWGYFARIHATQQMMKQAVGRLVRSESVPANRKLYFLDARMHSQDKQWTALFAAINRVLNVYEKRMQI